MENVYFYDAKRNCVIPQVINLGDLGEDENLWKWLRMESEAIIKRGSNDSNCQGDCHEA